MTESAPDYCTRFDSPNSPTSKNPSKIFLAGSLTQMFLLGTGRTQGR